MCFFVILVWLRVAEKSKLVYTNWHKEELSEHFSCYDQADTSLGD